MTGPANSWSEQLDPGRPFEDASQKMERTIMEAKASGVDLGSTPSRSVWWVQGTGCPLRFFDSESEAIAFLEEFKRIHSPACGDRGVT